MKGRLFLVCALAGALAVPVVAQAGSPTDRATGGGQVLVGERGAGDTIAFTARGTADDARGQVQYVDRTGGTGQGQQTFHGSVVCLRVEGNMAKLAGNWRDGGTFQILVVDNGEGSNAQNDVVTVQDMDDPTCDEEDDDDDGETALARGNAQVYDASQSQRRSSRRAAAKKRTTTTLTYTKSLRLAGLR